MRRSIAIWASAGALVGFTTPALADPFSLGALIANSLAGSLLGAGTAVGFGTGITIAGVSLETAGVVLAGAITLSRSNSLLSLDHPA